MEKITLTNTDMPVCGDGCCHKEMMILEVSGKRFEYDGDFMYKKDAIDQYETIIKDLLGAMNIDFELISHEV